MTGKILVTGGAGYIGSQCCKALAAAGLQPVVYDNLSTGRQDFVKWGPLVEGDVRDPSALALALTNHRPEIVMHFAALSLVGESVSKPAIYWDVNLEGTKNLLDAMVNVGCRLLVFSSTCAIYGEPDEPLITETSERRPTTPYGASKLAAELLIEGYEAAYGLRSARLRYFNASGADPEGELGEDRHSETHLVPLVLDAAAGRRGPLSIYGTDYPTDDGTAVRDYVHVADLADAHLAASRHLIDGGASLALNLGLGCGRSVAEIIAAASNVTGKMIPTIAAARRAGDPPRLVADAACAHRVLGWRPQRSSLEEIIGDAWQWRRRLLGMPWSEPTRLAG